MNPVEISTVQLTIGALISLLTGVIGAVGVWYNLKNKVNVMQVEVDQLKEDQRHDYKRFDRLKKEIDSNKEKHDSSLNELKAEMAQMELRIIKAIHELKM